MNAKAVVLVIVILAASISAFVLYRPFGILDEGANGYRISASSSCFPIDFSDVVDVGQRPRSLKISDLGLRSIDELQSKVNFTIKFPDTLPCGFSLQGAYEKDPLTTVEGKHGPYTFNTIVLIYWDKDLTEAFDESHARDDGALFISIVHAPGATIDDFGPPPPTRAIGDVPEPVAPPARGLATLAGNPAIVFPHSVEVFVLSEETVYRVNSDQYTSKQLIPIIESLVRG